MLEEPTIEDLDNEFQGMLDSIEDQINMEDDVDHEEEEEEEDDFLSPMLEPSIAIEEDEEVATLLLVHSYSYSYSYSYS